MKFLTLDDVDVANKCVFIRVDLNCPVEDGAPQKSPRLVAHAKTIFELMQKGAKVVILAHQGRKGKSDFISLEKHAKLLSDEISSLSGERKKILFVDDVAGEKAQNAIESMESGSALLLDNVRFLDSEKTFAKDGKSELIDNLSSFCEIFVLDAFSVSHRNQAPVTGFAGKCLCVAGRVMERELKALGEFDSPKKPTLLILGGAKPADSLPILQDWVKKDKVDYVLCGGAMGNLMLIASGVDIGEKSTEFLRGSGSLENLDSLKKFYSENKGKLIIPSDVVADINDNGKLVDASSLPSEGSILDIGENTSAEFCKLISNAGSIVLNGPMGVYEKDEFSSGTQTVFNAVASSSAYSLLGGGHTLSALEKFGISYDKFGYVSLSGKALIEMLSGEELPGVRMLEDSAKN